MEHHPRLSSLSKQNLVALLEPGGEAGLATFMLLFGRDSFVSGADGRSFVQAALDEARAWQERVTTQLAGAVFDDVFPEILRALSEADPEAHPAEAEWPEAVRHASLILLYRLLFLLYAEDRDLLPVSHDGYRPFAITTMRHEVAAAMQQGRPFSGTTATFWPRLRLLFRAVAGGDDAMGLPPYNGGLFEPHRAPLLNRVALSDAAFARVLDRLSVMRASTEEPRWINYRDLSVQQLGAIYEGLLQRGVEVHGGHVAPVSDGTLRHDIGAYYTPDELVRLVMHEAVTPCCRRSAWRSAQPWRACGRIGGRPARSATISLASIRRRNSLG